MARKTNLVELIKSHLTPGVYARWHLHKDNSGYYFETVRPAIGGIAGASMPLKPFEEKYNYSFTEEELKEMVDNKIPVYTLRKKFKHPILYLREIYEYASNK